MSPTQLALQLHQERTHVACGFRETRKRPARGHSRNGPYPGSRYSCAQITLDPSDFGSSRKQPKPIWRSPETANIQQKQQIIPANYWGFMLSNFKAKIPACFQNYMGSKVICPQVCNLHPGLCHAHSNLIFVSTRTTYSKVINFRGGTSGIVPSKAPFAGSIFCASLRTSGLAATGVCGSRQQARPSSSGTLCLKGCPVDPKTSHRQRETA